MIPKKKGACISERGWETEGALESVGPLVEGPIAAFPRVRVPGLV
jgi:hypothetical protein